MTKGNLDVEAMSEYKQDFKKVKTKKCFNIKTLNVSKCFSNIKTLKHLVLNGEGLNKI